MIPYFNHLLYLDRCIPLSALVCDSDILDRTSNLTALVKAYQSNLWQEDPAAHNLEALRKPYTIIQASLLEHRGSLQRLVAIKAIPEGPFKMWNKSLAMNLERLEKGQNILWYNELAFYGK